MHSDKAYVYDSINQVDIPLAKLCTEKAKAAFKQEARNIILTG